MEIRNESFLIKKTRYTLRFGSTDDGREWVELFNFLMHIVKVERKHIGDFLKIVPKPYVKNVMIGEDKIKFVDVNALPIIISVVDNYEAYSWVHSITFGDKDKYSINLFCDLSSSLHQKTKNIALVQRDLKDAEEAQQDMLHKAENENLTHKDKISFYDNLQDLRIKRRIIKNEFQYTRIFKSFFEKHDIKLSDLQNLANSINGVANLSTKKIYNKRAIKAEHDKFKTTN